MRTKDLEYFVSLIQLKSFSKVSEKFKVSQPTVSAAIQRLEREFNTHLIIRDNPHLPLKLTDSGQKLLVHSKNILSDYKLAQSEIAHGIENKLIIGMPPLIEITYLPKVARQLPTELFQQVMHISQGSIATLKDLKNGDLDVALLGYLDQFTDETIKMITFDEQPFSIIMPKTNRLANSKGFYFKDIQSQKFISLKNSFVQKQAFKYLSQINHIRPKIIFETSEVQSVINMVANGMGIALLSNSITINDPRLTSIPILDSNSPIFKVGLAYRRSSVFSPQQQKLLNAILTAFTLGKKKLDNP
ncbi:LysR family transcriptional regulator [Companilactobacillus nuruki]|uniref:LysR family transcriptional regulator n=1 Tax=Companilactobacillus nuruki TaxID=1993540 RepID=A0A2N7AVL8_9LACO|nr:LysR family transcriptional regulator [Companilactobacillus nuruki]PMD72216.1 LysR family transcriptional regulator [Companilactobacillus nuruki]